MSMAPMRSFSSLGSFERSASIETSISPFALFRPFIRRILSLFRHT